MTREDAGLGRQVTGSLSQRRAYLLSLAVSTAILFVLWAGILHTDRTPGGDGSRLIKFFDFARNTAHGFAFWNPFRNGGYPLTADIEHEWLLSLIVDPASPGGNLIFNFVLFAVINLSILPAWLIGRKLKISPYWTALMIIELGFNERLVWQQQSGRFEFLEIHFFTLIVIWILLSWRLRPWQYVVLAACLAIDFEEMAYKTIILCLLIYSALLFGEGFHRVKPIRHFSSATLRAAAVSMAGLLLSATWSLPLIYYVATSHAPLHALTYPAEAPTNVLLYGRIIVPFIPVSGELVSFISLLLVPALLLAAWYGAPPAAHRLLRFVLPIHAWAVIFIAISIPLVGPAIAAVYSKIPVVSGIRWFLHLADVLTIIWVIAAIAVLQQLERLRLGDISHSRRGVVAAFLVIGAGFAMRQALLSHHVLAWITAVLFCSYAICCAMAAIERFRLARVEMLSMKSISSSLIALSVMVTMVSQQYWLRYPEQGQVYTYNKPDLPQLEGIVRRDDSGYFRFIREDDTGLWFLDDAKRDFRAMSFYFPPGFAYSLIYLNAKEDIDQLRPHWVDLARCAEFDPRAIDLLGVKYAFCGDTGQGPITMPGWQWIGSENDQSLFRRIDYDGGLKLFHRWQVMLAKPPVEARESVLDSAHRGIALVETSPRLPAMPASLNAPSLPDRIELVADHPGAMQLNVTSARSGILFIPDNFDTGWSATVNGIAVMPVKVFNAYLGVPVSPGANAVKLAFHDKYFFWGLAISIATAAALVIYLIITQTVPGRYWGPPRRESGRAARKE